MIRTQYIHNCWSYRYNEKDHQPKSSWPNKLKQAFLFIHGLYLSKGGIQEVIIVHGQVRGFYNLGVGGFQMEELADKQTGL